MKEFRIFVFSIWAFLSTFLGLSYGSNQGNDTSQDIYEMRRCPLRLDTKLPGINCSNPYCGEITCSALFSLSNFTLTMRISQVDDRYRYLSAYVTLSVPELRFDWFRSFKDGEKAQVPRFPLKVKGFEGADVFLQVYLKKENGTIHFKVDLHANWRNLTTERTYNTTIFAGKTPEDGIMTMVICRFGPYPDDGGVSYGSNQGNDTSQDIYEMGSCPLRLDTKLPGINCSNPSCGEITCAALFSLKNFTLTMRISQVDDQYRYLSAYVTLSVPELRFDWSRSFKDGEKGQVPRFPLKVKGFEGADVFLQVYLKKENGTIHFKVDLHANWRNLTTERTYSTTIFAGKTPEDGIMTIVVCRFGPYPDDGDDHERPSHKRLKALPTFAKVLIAMAVCALILFLIVFATFYYFKKKKSTAIKVKPDEPPSYEEATSTKTKAPIQPQINHV